MASQKDKIKVFSAPLTPFQMVSESFKSFFPQVAKSFFKLLFGLIRKAEFCYMNLYEHSYSGNTIFMGRYLEKVLDLVILN